VSSFTGTSSALCRPLRVTWTDGELSGAPQPVAAVRSYAAEFEGRALRLPGYPATMHDLLSSPFTALLLIRMAIGSEARITTGSLPTATSQEDEKYGHHYLPSNKADEHYALPSPLSQPATGVCVGS
jgi:hypothetical protein